MDLLVMAHGVGADWWLTHIVEIALTAIVSGLIVYVKTVVARNHAMSDGIEALLRNTVLSSYQMYSARGWCDPEERIVLQRVYDAYHALGGNDVATNLYKKVLDLPTKDPNLGVTKNGN